MGHPPACPAERNTEKQLRGLREPQVVFPAGGLWRGVAAFDSQNGKLSATNWPRPGHSSATRRGHADGGSAGRPCRVGWTRFSSGRPSHTVDRRRAGRARYCRRCFARNTAASAPPAAGPPALWGPRGPPGDMRSGQPQAPPATSDAPAATPPVTRTTAAPGRHEPDTTRLGGLAGLTRSPRARLRLCPERPRRGPSGPHVGPQTGPAAPSRLRPASRMLSRHPNRSWTR